MADLSRLPDDIVYVLRTGKLPPGVTLPDSAETESQPVEDADEARFRERYHAMVDKKIADWLAAEDYQVGSLSDYRGQTVPPKVRDQIEADCNRQIQHEWRQLLQRRQVDDEDW